MLIPERTTDSFPFRQWDLILVQQSEDAEQIRSSSIDVNHHMLLS